MMFLNKIYAEDMGSTAGGSMAISYNYEKVASIITEIETNASTLQTKIQAVNIPLSSYSGVQSATIAKLINQVPQALEGVKTSIDELVAKAREVEGVYKGLEDTVAGAITGENKTKRTTQNPDISELMHG